MNLAYQLIACQHFDKSYRFNGIYYQLLIVKLLTVQFYHQPHGIIQVLRVITIEIPKTKSQNSDFVINFGTLTI